MMSKLTAGVLATLCVAAFVPQLAAAPPPPTMQVAAATAPPSDANVAPGMWDVTRVRCTDILHASDDDRAAAVMFYFGYLAAKYGIKVVDVNKLSDNIHKVMQQCGNTPDMPVTQAFRLAIGHPHK